MAKEKSTLDGFAQHGARFTGESPDHTQAVAVCPLCDNPKLYVHKEWLVWDCKTCGLSGNLEGFLREVSAAAARTPDAPLEALADDRGLYVEALRAYGVGYNPITAEYTLPLRGNLKNRISEVRRYRLGGKPHGTTGGHLSLFAPLGWQSTGGGAGADAPRPVYVCEGEWDALALYGLLCYAPGAPFLGREADAPLVVGCPGAGNFPRTVAPAFTGRDVVLLFDADTAGRRGLVRTWGLLRGASARSLRRLEWPAAVPEGYDIRDLWTGADPAPAGTFDAPRVLAWISDRLRQDDPAPEPKAGEEAPDPGAAEGVPAEAAPQETGAPVPAEEVEAAYRRHLMLPNAEPLDVLFGTAFANKIKADPLWLFVVAASGGGKSELLMSLSDSPIVKTTTTLTPQALISGANTAGGDPSLIPQIIGKILIVKDFTAILGMQPQARDEIFSILRDAYDGAVEKHFGNGVHRSYRGHFGVFAGVTPAIEGFMATGSVLGERFIKYYMRRGMGTVNAAGAEIDLALANLAREADMRADMRATARRALARPVLPEHYPTRPAWFDARIKALAQWVAVLRGAVVRERYTQQVLHKPTPEVGTRLAKQFALLGMGIGLYRGEAVLSERTYQTIAHVARDTAPDRVEEIVRQLYARAEDYVTTQDVAEWTRFPVDTVRLVLQDLALLRVVHVRPGSQGLWALAPEMRCKLDDLRIYAHAVEWTAARRRPRREGGVVEGEV